MNCDFVLYLVSFLSSPPLNARPKGFWRAGGGEKEENEMSKGQIPSVMPD